jgi:uncharacterized membrane protein HdeD (DUF308 family)
MLRKGRRKPVKRSGWLTFSGVVLIVAGIMRVLDAIWAFRYNGPVVDNLHEAVFGHSLTTYGWIWLIVGVILIVSGFPPVAVRAAPGSPNELAWPSRTVWGCAQR